MNIKDILDRFPRPREIYPPDLREYMNVPGLYLLEFNDKCGYVGQTNNIYQRLRYYGEPTPLLRFLGADPRDYPQYFLKRESRVNRRIALEKRIVEEFEPILLNIEHAPGASQRNKIDRTRKEFA